LLDPTSREKIPQQIHTLDDWVPAWRTAFSGKRR
jgi:hypothetical protein